MPKFIDRTGMRYGRLMVQKRVGTTASKKPAWECLCDCGNSKVVDSCSLVTGNTVSCGCYLKEKITKHGGYNKASYNTWRAMIRRCTNVNDKDYPRYGGSGIAVCAEWMDYKKFVEDMGEPEGAQTLDRIDPIKGYFFENCRWASPTTQARNIRLHKKNKSGVIGVNPVYKGKWIAAITANRKRFYSKVCDTIEEAAAARKELERLHWSSS
jgi:hypothetical protein